MNSQWLEVTRLEHNFGKIHEQALARLDWPLHPAEQA